MIALLEVPGRRHLTIPAAGHPRILEYVNGVPRTSKPPAGSLDPRVPPEALVEMWLRAMEHAGYHVFVWRRKPEVRTIQGDGVTGDITYLSWRVHCARSIEEWEDYGLDGNPAMPTPPMYRENPS